MSTPSTPRTVIPPEDQVLDLRSRAADFRNEKVGRDESYEERERRTRAAKYLESTEMLIWFAMQRNESVPQTKRHFERILAGLDSDDESSVEWEDSYDPNEESNQTQQSQKRTPSRISIGTAKSPSSKRREEKRKRSSGGGSRRISSGAASGSSATNSPSAASRQARRG